MKQKSYYINHDGGSCSLEVTDRAIAVNCTGSCDIEHSFVTDNPAGRADFYLQYLVGGEMDVIFEGQSAKMREGDVIVYHPHTHYHYAGSAGVRYYWVHFSGSYAAALLAECRLVNGRIRHVGRHDRLESAFERMFTDFITRDAYLELSLGTTLMRICLDIARLCEGAEPNATSDERIDRVLARIHQQYDRELSVAELAAGEFLSEGRLRTLFRQRCGMSPQRYLTALRISTAKQLLEQPDLTIADVARAVGIPDALYFSRIFRAHTGISPTEFRGR